MDLDPDRPWRVSQRLSLILRAVVAMAAEAPDVVAELTDDELAAAIRSHTQRLRKDRSDERVDHGLTEPQGIGPHEVVLNETSPGLIVGVENTRLQQQHMVRLHDYIRGRTAQGERRSETAIPAKDPQEVRAGFANEDSPPRRVHLEQGDDAAARQVRDERTRLEERWIELRLGRQYLIRQRVRSLVDIIRDDALPIAVGEGRGEDRNVRIAERVGERGAGP